MNSEEIIRNQQDELLATYAGPDRVLPVSEILAKIIEERKTRPAFQIKLGISHFDECMGRLKKGHLVVISGPPKNGKTSLALTFTKNFVEQGLKCLWFPFEMGHEDILENFTELFNENFDFYSPAELVDKEIEWVRQRVKEAKKKKYGCDVVFIDHTDFLKDRRLITRNVNINMASYVGGIIQGVKSLALEQNVIIFLLHHLVKSNWTKNDLPTSEDMRDTGQVAQLSDFVLMMVRKRGKKGGEQIYEGNEAIAGVIENRHGGKTKKFPLVLKNGFFTEKIDFVHKEEFKEDYQPTF